VLTYDEQCMMVLRIYTYPQKISIYVLIYFHRFTPRRGIGDLQTTFMRACEKSPDISAK